MFKPWKTVLAAALIGLHLAAPAQEFPSKTVRIIVPTSTGTASDLTARFIADQLGKEFRFGVVVDNKAGANGIVAVQQLLTAPPDGHTLLLTASGLYANPALYKNAGYDPVRDFRLLAPVNQTSFVLVTAPGFAASSFGLPKE